MLTADDHTPDGFSPSYPTLVERLKSPFRRFIYPLLNHFSTWWLSRQYDDEGIWPDSWLWGQRGNDYSRHRRRINQLLPIGGSRILIAGCGTGRDVLSWLSYSPLRVTGIDIFRYDRAWTVLEKEVENKYPETQIQFGQGNLSKLSMIEDGSIDIVGSDAVFEHVQNLPEILKEMKRILRPGGLLYATFGPLWFCWGGDHISGYDGESSGFNHLILARDDYQAYLDKKGPFQHSEDDGRTWIANDLFSYLRPSEYLSILNAENYKRRYVGVIVDPRAVRSLATHQGLRHKLLEKHREINLVITGMTIIYEKPIE